MEGGKKTFLGFSKCRLWFADRLISTDNKKEKPERRFTFPEEIAGSGETNSLLPPCGDVRKYSWNLKTCTVKYSSLSEYRRIFVHQTSQ